MRKIIMILIAVSMGTIAQAQEKKDTYIVKGDIIEATLYHDNGTIAQTGSFAKDGTLTGTWTSFDRVGNKTAVGNYENNQKVGKWFFWEKEVLREVDYKNSKIAVVNTWVNDGTQVVSNK